jgi:CRP-like cAMP-binding protein
MEEFRTFLSSYSTRTYAAGEIILHQEEVPSHMFVIKSGAVRNYDITPDGTEKPLMFDRQDEMFPIGWLFGLISESVYFYEAYTATEVYLVPRGDLQAFFLHYPDSQYALFRMMVARMLDMQIRFLALQQNRARDKLLHTLKFLIARWGRVPSNEQTEIDLPLTQQELANFTGLTRETVTIELKRLQAEGIISLKARRYTVNSERLHAILEH